MLFGLGEGLLIVAITGASPWSVLAQGISLNVKLSIGTITFLISVAVLILWIPLGQKPGMGTILNAIIILGFRFSMFTIRMTKVNNRLRGVLLKNQSV